MNYVFVLYVVHWCNEYQHNEADILSSTNVLNSFCHINKNICTFPFSVLHYWCICNHMIWFIETGLICIDYSSIALSQGFPKIIVSSPQEGTKVLFERQFCYGIQDNCIYLCKTSSAVSLKDLKRKSHLDHANKLV